jgi:hypothetical protein
MKFALRARFAAEFLGTAFLVAAVVGSGIMGERLAGGNVAIALLANTIATGAALLALILTFGSISGAHFNPAVTLADAVQLCIAICNVIAMRDVACIRKSTVFLGRKCRFTSLRSAQAESRGLSLLISCLACAGIRSPPTPVTDGRSSSANS